MPRNCLVLGGAACLWKDIEAARELGDFDGVIACNDAGAAWPGHLDAWVTLHPDKMNGWKAKRAEAGFAPAAVHIAHRELSGIDRVIDFRWEGSRRSGSSGLFAVKVAIEIGFDRIVLCGVPMDRQPHFFDTREWTAANNYRRGWQESLPKIKDKARSMSGYTAELLGRPDENWLR